jgi:hypothetical protein
VHRHQGLHSVATKPWGTTPVRLASPELSSLEKRVVDQWLTGNVDSTDVAVATLFTRGGENMKSNKLTGSPGTGCCRRETSG